MVDSEFSGNQSGYEGGALSNGSWDSHLLRITGSSFEGNASGIAGALSLASWSPADQVEVQDSVLRNNTADFGAAVSIDHWEGGQFDFVGVSFQDNIAADPSGCVLEAHVDEAGAPALITFDAASFSGGSTPSCASGNASISVIP